MVAMIVWALLVLLSWGSSPDYCPSEDLDLII